MARSSETRRQRADWDAELTGLLGELSDSPDPESVRRAIHLFERLTEAGKCAHQERVREALGNTLANHPKDVFDCFGMREIYEKSETAPLVGIGLYPTSLHKYARNLASLQRSWRRPCETLHDGLSSALTSS